jgi:hypothetical protein
MGSSYQFADTLTATFSLSPFVQLDMNEKKIATIIIKAEHPLERSRVSIVRS